jgi:hypothetical protein
VAESPAKTDVLEYSRRVAHQDVSVQQLEADASVSNYDKRQILALALYTIEYEASQRDKRSRRQRRAMALLRSFLSDSQRSQLRRSGHLLVRGSLGNYYRLYPGMGGVWRVEQRGSHWVAIASYCLHDYAEDDPSFVPSGFPDEGKRSRLPSADRTLAHLLMLRADEGEFRLLANESIRLHRRWFFQLHEERRQIERERKNQETAAA